MGISARPERNNESLDTNYKLLYINGVGLRHCFTASLIYACIDK